jgi:hypothetical protein
MPCEGPFGRVAVLGLGLMGGSLARAASSLSLSSRITGWSPKSTERDAALATGAAADDAHRELIERLWTGVGATPHDIGAALEEGDAEPASGLMHRARSWRGRP